VEEKSMMARLIERIGYTIAILALCATGWSVQAADDPLPSWNEGAAKSAIVEFVEAVTTEGGADFVAPDERIATFDNDGTLWVEQPYYTQLAFALDRIRVLRPSTPSGASSSRSRRCWRTTSRRSRRAASRA
jgi:hypothetical protein